MLKIFEATILLLVALFFTKIILKELKESKEIIKLFSSIVVIVYIITIVVVLICSFVISTKENTKQENEIVIELKED